MAEIWWLLAGLAAGLLAGAGIVWWLYRGRVHAPNYAALKRDHEAFREEVADHFAESARLINQLTDSYKAVFDHLSQGADDLVDPDTLRERLPATETGEVRIRRLGTGRRTGRKPEAGDDRDDGGEDPIGI